MIEHKEYFDYQKISKAINTYIQSHLDNDSFGGSILVAHRDEIILSRGYGMANIEHQIPNTPQTKFRLASSRGRFDEHRFWCGTLTRQRQSRCDRLR